MANGTNDTNRRALLATAGTLGAVAIAGCYLYGDNDQDEAGDGPDENVPTNETDNDTGNETGPGDDNETPAQEPDDGEGGNESDDTDQEQEQEQEPTNESANESEGCDA